MIEFKFSCPSCGQHIQATDAYSGRQINCPACQKSLVVPQAPGGPPPIPTTATPPPPPPSRSAPIAQRAAPVAPKKSNKALTIVVGVAAFLIAGTISFLLVSGGLSHLRGTSTPASSASAARKAAAANLPGPTASEIAKKVADQYAAFTSYSADGTSAMDLDMSKVDIKTIPGLDKVPANKKNSKQMQKQFAKPVKMDSGFTVKLGRPDMYRVQWDNKQAGMVGAVWSAGEGDFLSMAKSKYTKMDNRELAMASATGISGGVAGTMPAIFFNDTSSQLNFFKDGTRSPDDTVDGEDCYVLNGEAMGMAVTMWITKDTYLIKQKQMVFGGNATMPKVSDAQMEEQFKKMGNMTAQQKAQAKAAMKNVQPMLSQMKGTMTETYRNIETNKPINKTDFKYDLAPNATLSKSLF